MKPTLKKMIYTVFILAICFGIFFMWSTSSNYSKEDFDKTTTLNETKNTDKDSIHSIVTYNIRHLASYSSEVSDMNTDKNLKVASGLLKDIDADIICFQDIDFDSKRTNNINQVNEITKLGYDYIHESVNLDKKYILTPFSKPTGKVIAGQAVLSKYPIKHNERVLLTKNNEKPFYKRVFSMERIAQITKIVINGKEVIIINTHLDDANKKIRSKQTDEIINLYKKYSKDFPTILTGDFNSSITKEDAAIHKIFNVEGIGFSKYRKIDHIFFSKNTIQIIDSKVLNEFDKVSNHIPILMRFTLR